MKARNTSPYTCMYLVTKEIYDKLILSIDERDKQKIAELNRNEVGNENGAFPDIPPPPPPIPPPPPPQRHPSTISSDNTMDFAPDTSPPDTPRGYGEFIYPDEDNDNYIDDEIFSDTNNLYIDRDRQASIDRLPSLPYNFATPQPPDRQASIDRLPSLPYNFATPQPPTPVPAQQQPEPSTSANIFKRGKTNNKALVKKSKKPILYKNIPQAKEVPFEIVDSTSQSDMPIPPPPRAPENNQTIDANISDLTRKLGKKLRRSNKCQICGIQFLNRKALLKHQKDIHSNNKKSKKND